MTEFFIYIISDTVIDSVKMLPFLFLAYFIIELIEHTSGSKIEKFLNGSGKFGPLVGAVLGVFPQCGFSVAASNFYAGKIITLGTLIAVFIATSDEAVPLLLSEPDFAPVIGKFILIKFTIAVAAGFLIDLLMPKKKLNSSSLHDLCNKCDCNKNGIVYAALKHTFRIFAYILIISLIVSTAMELLGDDFIKKILISGSIFQPFIASLLGFIPNCFISVALTQLYISGTLSFGSLIAGLSTGAGIGIAVLFKMNKNLKDNLKIIALLYFIGAFSGVLIQILGI